MRLRALAGLVAVGMIAGGVVTASASAHQVMEPPVAIPASVIATDVTPTDVTRDVHVTPTDVTPTPATGVIVTDTIAPCPSTASASVVGPLPKLTADLQSTLAVYAKNPSGGSVEGWMDSGGDFGGGVPAYAVRSLMRQGLAAGLTDQEVQCLPAARIPSGSERSLRWTRAARLHRSAARSSVPRAAGAVRGCSRRAGHELDDSSVKRLRCVPAPTGGLHVSGGSDPA